MMVHQQVHQKLSGVNQCSMLIGNISNICGADDAILYYFKFYYNYMWWRVDSGIECDLNINNSVGIRNTHLLSGYGQCEFFMILIILSVLIDEYIYSMSRKSAAIFFASN